MSWYPSFPSKVRFKAKQYREWKASLISAKMSCGKCWRREGRAAAEHLEAGCGGVNEVPQRPEEEWFPGNINDRLIYMSSGWFNPTEPLETTVLQEEHFRSWRQTKLLQTYPSPMSLLSCCVGFIK